MAGFSVFVSDLPSISLKVLDFKVIKSVIKVFLSQTVHMSAPQPIGGGGGPIQQGGPAQPVGGPVQPAGFRGFYRQPLVGGYNRYIVEDNGWGNRGYIDPTTGIPWHIQFNGTDCILKPDFTYGPFTRNFVSAMEVHAIETGRATRRWSNRHFDENSVTFYLQWQRYHYPFRNANG